MQVMLNDERWQVSDDTTLMEVLAQVSDRAAAHQHMVTALKVGDRAITDRELQPLYLEKRVREVGAVRATSCPLAEMYRRIRREAQRLGQQLHQEGTVLLGRVRGGSHEAVAFDHWLGRLADCVEGSLAGMESKQAAGSELVGWIEELLRAREQRDFIRIGDVLEYEVLPRLLMPDVADDVSS